MLVLITVKVGMGLVVVLGPFCILALLFEPTKQFFHSWLGQALYYAIYAGLFMVVFMFIMGMFGQLQQGLIDLSKADQKIGRASCRDRVCQYVSISVFAV